MKTQDQKSILIEMDGEGWKFTCYNQNIDIDNGLYFIIKILTLKIKIYVLELRMKKILTLNGN